MKSWFQKWSELILSKSRPDELVIHAYPPLIFVWPIIFLGYFFAIFSGFSWVNTKLEAWIYITTLVTVLLTIGVDLNRNLTVVWIITFIACYFAARWLQDVKGVTIFHKVIRTIADLDPRYSSDMGFIASFFLSFFYVVVLIKARLNDRWRITHNEIEHRVLGQSDNAMARGAKRIAASYPDVLEALILGAGTITVYAAQGNTVLATIPHVPLLPFRMKKISHLLDAMSVTPEGTEEETSDDHHEDTHETS